MSARSHRVDAVPAIDWPDDAAPVLRERENQVLAADLGQLAANVASFDPERAQKTAEGDKLHETIATQKNLVATLQERVNMRTKLVEEKAGAKAAVIDATENAAISDHPGGEAGAGSGLADRRARGHRPHFRQGGPGLHLR
jgi:hemolysin D